MATKYLQKREVSGGMGGGHTEVRVVEISGKERPPAGAWRVSDDATEHDWTPEASAPPVTKHGD
jgi:hypothetical protein